MSDPTRDERDRIRYLDPVSVLGRKVHDPMTERRKAERATIQATPTPIPAWIPFPAPRGGHSPSSDGRREDPYREEAVSLSKEEGQRGQQERSAFMEEERHPAPEGWSRPMTCPISWTKTTKEGRHAMQIDAVRRR